MSTHSFLPTVAGSGRRPAKCRPLHLFPLFLLLVFVAPSNVLGDQCVDYADYLHWLSERPTGGLVTAVERSGDYAYVSEAHPAGRFLVIDVANPEMPAVVGSTSTPSAVYDIALADSFACVVNIMPAWFQTVDISNPASPVVIGSIPAPGHAVAVSGNFAYATGSDGLAKIDVSNPSLPWIVQSNNAVGPALDLCVSGGYVYIADGSYGFTIVDAADSTLPIVANVGLPGYITRGVDIAGNYAYVTTDDPAFLHVIRVSNPSSPVLVGSVSLVPDGAGDVKVQGNQAFISALGYGILQVVDISSPSSPTLVGTYRLPDWSWGLATDDSLVYVGCGYPGLQIFRIGNATTVQPVGGVNTQDEAKDVAVEGSIAYVANGTSMRLLTIDVSDLGQPSILGEVVTPGYPNGVALAGDLAYVSAYQGGLYVVDVSDSSSPQVLGVEYGPSLAHAVAWKDGYAYIADDVRGLRVIDVSDSTSPSITKTVGTPGAAWGVAISGNHAFVAEKGAGLQVIDISVPDSAMIVGSVTTSGQAVAVAIQGQYAYVADQWHGLQIVDISNVTAPEILGVAYIYNEILGVTVRGDYVFVTDGDLGIYIIDITDPMAPRIIGGTDTPGVAFSVFHGDSVLYVADGTAGLQILPAHCDIIPPPPGPDTLIVLRADSADGAGPYPSPGVSSPWVDLAGVHDFQLSNFDATSSSGWQGDGTPSSPYRLQFDGVNDVVTLPAGSVSELQQSGVATVALWVKTGNDMLPHRYLFEWVESYSPPFPGMTFGTRSDSLTVYLSTGGPQGWVNVAPVRPNSWYHVAVAKDSSEVRAYLNGSRVFISTNPHLGSQMSEIVLGGSTFRGPGIYGEWFEGAMAQVTIWARPLGDIEIAQAFQADAALYPFGPSKLIEVRAELADGSGPYTVPGADPIWTDLAGSHDFTLAGFDGTPSSGWNGYEIEGLPYWLQFDGIDDRATIPGASVPELQNRDAATASMWFRTGADIFSHRYLFEWLENYAYPFPGLTFGIQKDSLSVYLATGVGNSWVQVAPAAPHTWYYMAVTKDAGGARVYVNGQEVYAHPTSNLGFQLSEIMLGASTYRGPGGYGEFFDGGIAQVSIWPYALSGSEVLADYQADMLFFREPTGVESTEGAPIPRTTELLANTPNPFNPTTTIRFNLREPEVVGLSIYDVSGRLVRALIDQSRKPAGSHSVVWDGRDETGHAASSGIYFSRFQTGKNEQVRKMILVR